MAALGQHNDLIRLRGLRLFDGLFVVPNVASAVYRDFPVYHTLMFNIGLEGFNHVHVFLQTTFNHVLSPT
jgi:hypothetical protein